MGRGQEALGTMNAELQLKIEALEQAVKEKRASMREFYALVKEIRKEPGAISTYAGRLGEINRLIFFSEHRFRVPMVLGTGIELLVFFLAAGLGSATILQENSLAIVVAQVLTVSTLHPLAHVLAGKSLGMGFLGYYFNGPMKIEPGVKVDYASFLVRTSKERAFFFFAGVLGTLIPAFFWLMAGFVFPHSFLVRFLLLGITAAFVAGEFLPLLFIHMGKPHLFGFSWYRGELYKTFRELKR